MVQRDGPYGVHTSCLNNLPVLVGLASRGNPSSRHTAAQHAYMIHNQPDTPRRLAYPQGGDSQRRVPIYFSGLIVRWSNGLSKRVPD